MLRSGAFSGLRASVRALGDYAAERSLGKDAAGALVTGFFVELEGLDFELLKAVREGRTATDDAQQRLNGTITALDK